VSRGETGPDRWLVAAIPGAEPTGVEVEDFAQSVRAVGQVAAAGTPGVRR
jgi:hypothetical protein